MQRHAIKKSLRVSFWDGVFAAAMTGLTAEYFTPYALALKASVSQIGLLTALPSLAGSFSQLKSADITESVGSRRKVICFLVFLQALVLLPVVFVPHLFKNWAVGSLIVLVSLFNVFGAFSLPVWQSLMTDYLPYNKRGRYFGWRNKVLGGVTIISLFGAGMTLNFFKSNILLGFLIIFSLACLCRFICVYFLAQMYESRQHLKKEAYFSFWDFLKRARESNFARFVIFNSAFIFCVYLASPFFSVLMLKDLKFNYFTYTVLISTVSIAAIFTIDRWGRSADRIGSIKVLRVSSLLIASLPFWWILNQHPVYLIFAQVLSGIAWAGFNLCSVNFIYDAVTPAKRTRCIAYFYFFNGLAICLGSFVGGLLANRLPNVFGYRLFSLFFIAGTLRFIVALTLPRRIKEVRPVEKISSKDLFLRIVGLRPNLE
ncbi:MAG: MFS transporter [Candidatus Omnitrophica bacterium]|nr:MFS transporter [Candidatus Omnitrophota bacterium]